MKHLLYTDGGLITPNPSEVGGTWAYVIVKEEDGEEVIADQGSGVCFVSKTMPAVSSNLMEMVAMFHGLRALSKIERQGGVTAYCDSEITIERVFGDYPWRGIPVNLKDQVQYYYSIITKSVPDFDYVLLAGHPNKNQLATGIRVKKNGAIYPVSKWNVLCDNICTEIAKKYR